MSDDGGGMVQQSATEEPEGEFEFDQDISQLLGIIDAADPSKEIFLRELISNATNTLIDIQFRSVSDAAVLGDEPVLKIEILPDEKTKTLTIRDTGVGMTRDDLIKLGTVAHSRAKQLTQAITAGDTSTIGQFAGGFYTAYAAAENVVVRSKHNDDNQHVWESAGGTFFVRSDAENSYQMKRGTEIILYLKEDYMDYVKPEIVKHTVKKYSQSVHFPIMLFRGLEECQEDDDSDEDDSEDVQAGTEEWELLNMHKVRRNLSTHHRTNPSNKPAKDTASMERAETPSRSKSRQPKPSRSTTTRSHPQDVATDPKESLRSWLMTVMDGKFAHHADDLARLEVDIDMLANAALSAVEMIAQASGISMGPMIWICAAAKSHQSGSSVELRYEEKFVRPKKPTQPPVEIRMVTATCDNCGMMTTIPDGSPCTGCFQVFKSDSFDDAKANDATEHWKKLQQDHQLAVESYKRRLFLLRRLGKFFPNEALLRNFVGALDVNFLFLDRHVVNEAMQYLSERGEDCMKLLLFKLLHDEKRKSEHRLASSSTGKSEEYRDENFRRNLFLHWGIKDARCWVSGATENVQAAHIVDVKFQDDQSVRHEMYSRKFHVNNPCNGMFLQNELHAAFDGGLATVVMDDFDDYHYFVFDQRASAEAKRWHGSKVKLPSNDRRKLFSRAMWWHCNTNLQAKDSRKAQVRRMFNEGFHFCVDESLASDRETLFSEGSDVDDWGDDENEDEETALEDMPALEPPDTSSMEFV